MCNERKEEYCCVCGEKHSPENIKKVEIKGETKKICKECVDTIHGLA